MHGSKVQRDVPAPISQRGTNGRQSQLSYPNIICFPSPYVYPFLAIFTVVQGCLAIVRYHRFTVSGAAIDSGDAPATTGGEAERFMRRERSCLQLGWCQAFIVWGRGLAERKTVNCDRRLVHIRKNNGRVAGYFKGRGSVIWGRTVAYFASAITTHDVEVLRLSYQ